jgi:predicted RNase H-like HicB family nuclease
MKEFAFTVIIEPDNGSYHAYVPALKGCHTFGDTLEEAQTNIVEAMQLHLESMLEDGEEIPRDISSLMIQRLSSLMIQRLTVAASS